jgi:5'(3')-deoxyribonucleotidase
MPRIFIDMDGVVADFDAEARKIMNLTDEEMAVAYETGRYPDEKWALVRNYQNFYRYLPKMPRADAMINVGRHFRDHLGYELRMLTAIPKDNDFPEAFNDKILWMQERYPEITVWFGPYSVDKAQHCTSAEDILIDDRPSNIEAWRAAGGRAVHVTQDYDKAIMDALAIRNEIARPQDPYYESPPQAPGEEDIQAAIDAILAGMDTQP